MALVSFLEVVETEGPADKEAMDAVVDKTVDVEAVGIDEAVDLEAVETVGQEAAEGAVDKVLGLQAAKSAFLYQAQNLQQSFGHCSSEYFEYFEYFVFFFLKFCYNKPAIHYYLKIFHFY